MSKEQKIVYAGLSRMTTDRVVIKNAFDYWQANLSANTFDIVDITSKLVAFLGLTGSEKKTLMIAMHSASSKSDVELDDVPGFLLGGEAAPAGDASTPKATSSSTPQFQITHGYLKGLIDAVRMHGSASFSEMDEILRDEGLNGVSSEVSQRVKQNGFSDDILPSKVSEDECRTVAHELYMLIIDVIGPVDADIMVTRVIDSLIRSDMASRFDPRTLI